MFCRVENVAIEESGSKKLLNMLAAAEKLGFMGWIVWQSSLSSESYRKLLRRRKLD